MAGWVGALARGTEKNWTVCKVHGLWGTGSAAGRGVRAGDELFVWWSGRGWLAHCVITSSGRAPRAAADVPWVEPERYRYVFDIRVLAQATPPAFMTGDQVQKRLGLHTIRLGQFPRIDEERVLEHLRSVIHERAE